MIATEEDAGLAVPIEIKRLLTAVLERAIRDLNEACQHEKRAALNWFKDKGDWSKNTLITYTQVKEFLQLGNGQLKYIDLRVKQAERKKCSPRNFSI